MTVNRTIIHSYTTSKETEKYYYDYFIATSKNLGVEKADSYLDWVNWIIDNTSDEELINSYGFTIEKEFLNEDD